MAPTPDWNLKMVRSREARRLLPKVPGSGTDAVAWGNVRVAHLDTGYTEHPAFGDWAGGAAWLRVADGLNLREPGQQPRDPLDYEGNPGHGTRTCSILCGEAVPLPGEGGAPSEIGVAPRLPVVPCRIVDSVVLTPERNREAVKEGLKHAVRTGCQVVSISLGVPGFPPWAKGGMGRGVDRAYEAGVIMVAAAGQIIDRVCYPAKYDRTIGVGGVTWERRIWFRYNNGEDMIDVWAPAEGVPRADSLALGGSITVFPTEGADPGASGLSGGGSDSSAGSHSGKYGKGAGTSYATAHVAAAAAMWLLARKDDLAEAYSEPWQRVEAFRRLLRATAKPIDGGRTRNGTGILDIEALLQANLPPAGSLRMAPEDKRKFA